MRADEFAGLEGAAVQLADAFPIVGFGIVSQMFDDVVVFIEQGDAGARFGQPERDREGAPQCLCLTPATRFLG